MPTLGKSTLRQYLKKKKHLLRKKYHWENIGLKCFANVSRESFATTYFNEFSNFSWKNTAGKRSDKSALPTLAESALPLLFLKNLKLFREKYYWENIGLKCFANVNTKGFATTCFIEFTTVFEKILLA